MYVYTSWKSRPFTNEQSDRFMGIWGKIETDLAAIPSLERICWFLFADGSGGFQVVKTNDVDAANAFSLEVSLALGEFLEFESKVLLDLEAAMPAILKAFERSKA